MEALIEMGLWPAILDITSTSIILFSSIFTSGITAAFGLGGGVIMLAILVNFIPVASVIPVHGFIQLSANASRFLIMRKNMVKEIVLYYMIGAVIGVVIGGQFVVALPEAILLFILGVFILANTWLPKPNNFKMSKWGYGIGGVVVTFATMFIGATGPLAMSLIPRSELEPKQVSATHGALMVVQHGFKVITFMFLGFQFKEWAIFLALMLVGSSIGSYFGAVILNRLPKRLFEIAISLILTLLALRMLYQAILAFMA